MLVKAIGAGEWSCGLGAGDAGCAPAAMTIVQSLLLGIIEGVTEYLPVSSTGHLIVAQRFMGIGTGDELSKQAADAFAICIQGGAILAVLGLYWPRVMQMLRGLLGKDSEGFRLLVAIVCGFLPAAVIGLAFNDWIEAHLFGLWPVVGAWIVGGVAILAVAWWRRGHPTPGGGRELAEITWKMALIIGFMQCVAMWPGTSRSLMTIVGGVMVGLTLRAAVEFSFLLGVVTLTAATGSAGLDSAATVARPSGVNIESWAPAPSGASVPPSNEKGAAASRSICSFVSPSGWFSRSCSDLASASVCP